MKKPKFQIGDLALYKPYGYTAIILQLDYVHWSAKIKPLDYNANHEVWVPQAYLSKVS